MPIITVQFIKDVVATPDQKRELIVRLTDTFVDVLGEVVRPFVYCLIQETPQNEWGIAGVPMPDLVYLTGEQHSNVIGRSNDLMREAIASMAAAANAGTTDSRDVAPANAAEANERADKIWRGQLDPSAPTSGAPAGPADAARVASGTSSPVDHQKLFSRWFEEIWNRKNYDIAYELVDPEFVAHGAGGQSIKQGPAGVIEMVKAWHEAMPDGRMTIDDIISEGDLATIRMTWRGTHSGRFGDIPASGNRVEVTSIGIDRVVDGKITEGWGELNMLGMLQQMEAMATGDSAPASPQVESPSTGTPS